MRDATRNRKRRRSFPRRTRLSRPAVVALAALAIGGATAAYAIKDIPMDPTIHGCAKTTSGGSQPVGALSVRQGDSCPAGTREIDWNRQGPRGRKGPAGPSFAYGRFRSGSFGLDSNAYRTVVLRSVPRGHYAVVAKTQADNHGGEDNPALVSCRLTSPVGTDKTTTWLAADKRAVASMSLQQLSTGGTIAVSCKGRVVDRGDDFVSGPYVSRTEVTIVKIGGYLNNPQ